jgi:hypothetical protein
MKASRLALTTGLITVLLAAGGCRGGDETLSKAEMIQRGTAICKAGERSVGSLPQLTSQHPLGPNASRRERRDALRFISGYANALATVRSRLAELELPRDNRLLLERFIADLDPIVGELRKAARLGRAGHGDGAEAAVNHAFALFAKASERTAAYGFPRGVCRSGESS